MSKPYAVVSLWTENFNPMAKVTEPFLRHYANRLGADFIRLDSVREGRQIFFEKVQLRDLLQKYQRILYMDIDVLIRPDCPNLFELVPEGYFGAFNEGKELDFGEFIIRCRSLTNTSEALNLDYEVREDLNYFNAGILVLSQCHADLFEYPRGFIKTGHFADQDVMNIRITGRPCVSLPHCFNHMRPWRTSGTVLSSYILHYAGWASVEEKMEICLGDLAIWKTKFPHLMSSLA